MPYVIDQGNIVRGVAIGLPHLRKIQPEAHDLIQAMLQAKAHERPTMQEATYSLITFSVGNKAIA